MRVTIELDTKLRADLVALTGRKNTERAVRMALEEYVRQKKMDELMQLSGQIDIESDWRELRHGEGETAVCREVPPFTLRQVHLKWLREAARKGRRAHKPRSPFDWLRASGKPTLRVTPRNARGVS